ncbi:MAG TPA: hypothetical protein VML75_27315 [Kofleriaceae bacterium]|nr:hypothetical protein [Kofleriaceae bacterium]
MRTFQRIAAITIATLCATSVVARAQDVPETTPTPTAPARTAEAEPGVAVTATPTSVDEPPAIEEDAAPDTTGWFRVDTDGLSTQFWFGATHNVGSLAIASDIYVVGSFAEFDIGPAFTFGDLAVTPMVGLGFDFSTKDVASLIAPQLFTIYNHDKVYFESWVQVFLNSLFTDGAEDTFYTRNFLLYKLTDQVQLGPAMELTYRINEDEMAMLDRTVLSLPVGGALSLGYGDKNTLLLFLGYDTKDQEGSDNIAGRFSFIRTW